MVKTEEECAGGVRKKQFTFKWQLKFLAMIVFTGVLFMLKVIVGHLFNSLALVADSFHMITDFAALTIGFIALRLANSKTNNTDLAAEKFTFGWIRAEVLGGLINTVFLFALCFSVFVASLQRFIESEDITHPIPVLIVGIVSLFVNFVGLFLFRQSRDNICQCCFGRSALHKCEHQEESLVQQKKTPNTLKRKISFRRSSISSQTKPTWQHEYQTPHSLNIRGVYLHILEHFLSSFIVIISALISQYAHRPWTKYVDPSFTMLVVLMILHSTVPLFRETLILFMQSVPANIQVKDMEERLMRKVPSVMSVHEFHLWQLGGDRVVASAHVLFKDAQDYKKNSESVKLFFQNEGIACMTFQPEFLPKEQLKDYFSSPLLFSPPVHCFYSCSRDENNGEVDCKPFTCCGMENGNEKNHCKNHELQRPPNQLKEI